MLYLSEHAGCRNYEGEQRSSIEYRKVRQGERIESQFQENKIIFLVKGEFCVNCGGYDDSFPEGHLMVIPAGTPYVVTAREDTEYIICRVCNNLHLCEEFSLEKLFHEEDTNDYECRPLPFCEAMQYYVEIVYHYLQDGIRCRWFFDVKMKELMFILRNYYTKEELKHFFSPLLSDDIYFSDFVLKNHRKVKNLKEFAELANYSISGFEKRFKKVFHVSAYKWMKEQKAKEILHDIHTSDKTFKEIGWEYGFSSPAQFNDFCKANFDMTPGQIRSSVVKPDE
ncbi:MAG: helix-turn-helix domain-containing protein [Tannerellaceae bacterium]|nr:helix-turn-helix domain-containing protein [Tannerellaceae bacterium]